MANKRIKDLTQTATTLASDDYVAIDGSSNGTRKIVKGDLVNDISSQVAGTYLDEANNLSDVASLDTSKLNLEVPDVGTAPNEVPLNGMLGDMAYQSSDGVSVGTLTASGKTTLTNDSDNALVVEATNKNPMYVNVVGTAPNYLFDVRDDGTSKFRVDGSGNVSIGSSTIGSSSTTISGTDAFTLDLYRPATGYTNGAFLSFDLNNDAAERTSYALIGGRIADDTDGSESGELVFRTKDSGGALTTRALIDSSGRLGVNQSYPSSFNSAANDLVCGDGSGDRGMTIVSGTGSNSNLFFADGTGAAAYRGRVQYNHLYDELRLGTAGGVRWTINSTGNLVAGANLGIDFGSVATSAGDGTGTTGTPANSVLSDYEFGSWTPRFEMTGANFAAITMDVIAAQYVKIGRHVHCQAYIRTDNVDTTGASGTVAVQGLPFVSDTTASNYATLSVGYSSIWVNAPTAGYVQPNATYVHLTRNGTTGVSMIGVSDITNGSSSNVNELIFTVSYIAST